MQPFDKFGKPIYSYIFHQMKEHGEKLISLGYQETREANLFILRNPSVVFMADMRGTQYMPIWKDPRPVVYVSNRDEVEIHGVKRDFERVAWRIELARLQFGGLDFRLHQDDDPRSPSGEIQF